MTSNWIHKGMNDVFAELNAEYFIWFLFDSYILEM